MRSQQKRPGFRQDGEDSRLRQEQQREWQIKADNLSARIQSQFTPARIDPATGRTFGYAAARGTLQARDLARLQQASGRQNRAMRRPR